MICFVVLVQDVTANTLWFKNWCLVSMLFVFSQVMQHVCMAHIQCIHCKHWVHTPDELYSVLCTAVVIVLQLSHNTDVVLTWSNLEQGHHVLGTVRLYAERSLQLSEKHPKRTKVWYEGAAPARYLPTFTSAYFALYSYSLQTVFFDQPSITVLKIPAWFSRIFFRHEFRHKGWWNFPGCRDGLLQTRRGRSFLSSDCEAMLVGKRKCNNQTNAMIINSGSVTSSY